MPEWQHKLQANKDMTHCSI